MARGLTFSTAIQARGRRLRQDPGHFLALLAAGVRVSPSLFFVATPRLRALFVALIETRFLFSLSLQGGERGGGFRTCPSFY